MFSSVRGRVQQDYNTYRKCSSVFQEDPRPQICGKGLEERPKSRTSFRLSSLRISRLETPDQEPKSSGPGSRPGLSTEKRTLMYYTNASNVSYCQRRLNFVKENETRKEAVSFDLVNYKRKVETSQARKSRPPALHCLEPEKAYTDQMVRSIKERSAKVKRSSQLDCFFVRKINKESTGTAGIDKCRSLLGESTYIANKAFKFKL